MGVNDRRIKAAEQGLERHEQLTHRVVFAYCLEAMRRLRAVGAYEPDVVAAQVARRRATAKTSPGWNSFYEPDVVAAQVARQYTGGDVSLVRLHLEHAKAVVRARGDAPADP